MILRMMMMANNITIANAKEHCRTCLCVLTDCLEQSVLANESQWDNTVMTDRSVDELQSRNTFIYINNSKSLHSLLRKYLTIENVVYPDHDLEYPQKMCLSCFTKLLDFEKFITKALDSAEKLHTIFNISDGLLKTNDLNPTATTTTIESDSGSKSTMLVKDELLEMESVLLHGSHTDRTDIDILEIPDPFEPILDDSTNLNKLNYAKFESNSINADAECLSVTSPEQIKQISKCRKRCRKQEIDELRKSLGMSKPKRTPRRKKGLKNTFKCDQCNHSFAHKITLDAHVRKIHEGLKRAYKCDRCDKSYTFVGGLYNHIKEYHETANRSYQCDYPDCDRVYSSLITVQRHKLLKHSNAKLDYTYVCEQCGATFSHYTNLKYHIKSRHPTAEQLAAKAHNTERYICDICQKQFYSRYTLKYHKLQLHSLDMKYECKVCGRRMAKKFMLIQHMLVHSADAEKLPCHHCNKKFIRKFELDSHIKAVHMKLKPYECQYCTECFASRKTLRHHEYIHTGEKPYVCTICGQSYRQQTSLKNHRKTHEKSNSQTMGTITVEPARTQHNTLEMQTINTSTQTNSIQSLTKNNV